MKKSDYDSIITLLSNQDTVVDGIVQLNDKLTADEVAYDEIVKSNNTLRDLNAKYALRVMGSEKPAEPEKPKTDEEIFNELFTSRFNNQ